MGILWCCSAKLAMREKQTDCLHILPSQQSGNYCPHWYSLLIFNGHFVYEFLPGSNVKSREGNVGDDVKLIHGITYRITVEQEHLVLLSSGDSRRFQKLKVLHEALKALLVLLNWYTPSGFPTSCTDNITKTGIPSGVSYTWVIQEARDMSSTFHGTRCRDLVEHVSSR